jgi:hypothetical protein
MELRARWGRTAAPEEDPLQPPHLGCTLIALPPRRSGGVAAAEAPLSAPRRPGRGGLPGGPYLGPSGGGRLKAHGPAARRGGGPPSTCSRSKGDGMLSKHLWLTGLSFALIGMMGAPAGALPG